MEHAQLKQEVAAAKRGSSAAFGRLYAAHAADLYRFALWYVHNESDAEDAVQEAMLSAWEHIRALKKEEAFRSWLFKILANACKTQLRNKGRLTVVSIEGEPVPKRLPIRPPLKATRWAACWRGFRRRTGPSLPWRCSATLRAERSARCWA